MVLRIQEKSFPRVSLRFFSFSLRLGASLRRASSRGSRSTAPKQQIKPHENKKITALRLKCNLGLPLRLKHNFGLHRGSWQTHFCNGSWQKRYTQPVHKHATNVQQNSWGRAKPGSSGSHTPAVMQRQAKQNPLEDIHLWDD